MMVTAGLATTAWTSVQVGELAAPGLAVIDRWHGGQSVAIRKIPSSDEQLLPVPSSRANGSRECALDDRLREAIQNLFAARLDCFVAHAPRNDAGHKRLHSGAREA